MFVQVNAKTMQIVSILTDSSGADSSQYIEITDKASLDLIKSQMLAINPLMRMYYDSKKKTVSLKIDMVVLKDYKTKEISAACMNECEGGYPSAALGQAYMYPSKVLDQQNLYATQITSMATKADQLVLCAKLDGTNWALRSHTPEQLAMVAADCTAFITTKRAHYNELLVLIENATTQEDVEAVTW